jgi:hypothetical protein
MPSWKSPLEGFENADSLPTTLNADGKSLFNPPGPKSATYDEFPKPINSSNNGFDFHSKTGLQVFCVSLILGLNLFVRFALVVYYMQAVESDAKFAKALHERVRREFPEVCFLRLITVFCTHNVSLSLET